MINCPYKSQFLLLKFTMLVKSPLPLLLEHQCPQSSFPPSGRMGARNHLRVISLIRRGANGPTVQKKTFYYSPEFLSWSRPSASPF